MNDLDTKDVTVLVYDIKFYKVDNDGNEVVNSQGIAQTFRLKQGVRFKPLEHLTDDMDEDILEEV